MSDGSSALFGLIGIGLMIWLYIRFYMAVIRIEKWTKTTAEFAAWFAQKLIERDAR